MNNKRSLSTISTHEFWIRLQNRTYEDITAIKSVESYFQKIRGYVVTVPKPGKNIILLTSGGLDSTIVWYLLMKQFRLIVYPLFIGSNPLHPQRRSLYFFSGLFKKEFGRLYRPPFIMSQHLIAKKIDTLTKTKNIHPKILLDIASAENQAWGMPHMAGLNALTPISALLYSKYLLITKNLAIHTIVCAVAAGDGTVVKSQTFSFLRTTMFFLSQFFQDRKLQFFSLLLDKNLGYFIEKAQLIHIGARLGLPIHKTYSCYAGKIFHCGKCLGCCARKYEFSKANVADKTIYWDTITRKIRSMKMRVRSVIKCVTLRDQR